MHTNGQLKKIITKNYNDAVVERLFSMGSDILRAKRSSLTADNFEKLVFIKGNLPLLDEKSFLDQRDMADEDEDE